MKLIEDAFCLCFLLVSSTALLCQLGNASSFITVQCKNSKTFCLKQKQHESSFMYTLTANDLEFRCNSEGYTIWFRLLVVLGTLCSLGVFCVPLYAWYHQPATIHVDLGRIFPRLVHIFASIITVFMILFIILPIACYVVRSGERGLTSEVWASPLRGVGFLVWNIFTAPLRWTFHDRLRTSLDLDKLYPNVTCVEPGNNLLSCSTEFLQTDLSSCDNVFYCTQDCFVVFPKIVINSLSFILALLAMFHRLLELSHYITRGEMEIDLITSQKRNNAITNSDRDLRPTQNFEQDFDGNIPQIFELNDFHSSEKDRESNTAFNSDRELNGIRIHKDSVALTEGGASSENLEERFVHELCASEMKDKSVVLRETKPKTVEARKREKDVYPRRSSLRKRVQEKNSRGIQENTLHTPNINKEGFQRAERLPKPYSQNGEVTSSNECKDYLDKELNVACPRELNLERANGILPAGSKLADLEERSSDLKGLPNETSKEIKTNLLPACKKNEVVFAESASHSKNNTKLPTNSRYYSEQKTQDKAKHSRSGISNGHLKQDEKTFQPNVKAENGVFDEAMGCCNVNEEHGESSSEDTVEEFEGIMLVEDESEFYMSGFRL